jgi:hypothetical protein
VRTRANRPSLRVAGSAFVSVVVFLEGGCSSGGATGAPSSGPALAAYEKARATAWDPSRRFKALFKAEVSPKVGAIGRGWLSVWWDGASGSLAWRASAPIAGSGRGGVLRKGRGEGGAESALSPLPGRLSAPDLIACILGMPAAPASTSLPFEETPRGWRLRIDDSTRTILTDKDGKPIELSFPGGEIVRLQPGDGVPRRIEANGPDGRAVLTLESYGPWTAGEEVPPL